jgi:hypothetical protein
LLSELDHVSARTWQILYLLTLPALNDVYGFAPPSIYGGNYDQNLDVLLAGKGTFALCGQFIHADDSWPEVISALPLFSCTHLETISLTASG